MRGKRFGYALEEIADMIGLATDDIDEKEQIRRTLRYAEKSLHDIRQRMEELKMLEAEILEVHDNINHRLQRLEKDEHQADLDGP
jgi:hypothetical protein